MQGRNWVRARHDSLVRLMFSWHLDVISPRLGQVEYESRPNNAGI